MSAIQRPTFMRELSIKTAKTPTKTNSTCVYAFSGPESPYAVTPYPATPFNSPVLKEFKNIFDHQTPLTSPLLDEFSVPERNLRNRRMSFQFAQEGDFILALAPFTDCN